MEEKIIRTNKNGMVALLTTTIAYLLSIVGLFTGIFIDIPVLLIISIIWMVIGWIPFMGLKIIKPQEAMVLTLFGHYVGTLKEEGFHFVNPFCTSVNPAARTKLGQSGDVNHVITNADGSPGVRPESGSKKISLKIMTLNNNRQKINDCLGNPVEIGIAVMWRVVDTAKAVFDVDNYKEYLSLQCDSALRNIVRSYPMMLLQTLIPPVMELPTRAVSGVPAKQWQHVSAKRFSRRYPVPVWRLLRQGLLIWPMHRKLQP